MLYFLIDSKLSVVAVAVKLSTVFAVEKFVKICLQNHVEIVQAEVMCGTLQILEDFLCLGFDARFSIGVVPHAFLLVSVDSSSGQKRVQN